MSEIESLVEWVITLVSDNLYLGVFVAALIETVFPPIPSEAIFPLAGYIVLQNDMPFIHVIGVGITGGLGATLGALLIYLIALKLGRIGLYRYMKYAKVKEASLKKAEKWFEKYGDKSVIFGRMVPGIREIVSIPAGLFRMRLGKFLLFTSVGSCTWSLVLTFVGYYLGIATLEIF